MFKTLVIYVRKTFIIICAHIKLENILKDPTNEKRRKINMKNKAFNKRIGTVIGGKFMMQALGFVEEGGFYVMKEVNVDFLTECVGIF